MSIQELQTLFLRDLTDMYAIEQHTVTLLEAIVRSSSNRDVRATIHYHAGETRQHAMLLEQVFKILGTKPEVVDWGVVNALQADFDALVADRNMSPDILTMAGLDVVNHLEHLEISCYRALIRKAQLLNETDSAERFARILKQEEHMAHSVSELSNAVGRQLMEHVTT